MRVWSKLVNCASLTKCASWSKLVNCARLTSVRGQLCEVKCAGSSVRVGVLDKCASWSTFWSKLVCWTSVRVECAGEVCEVAKIVSVRGGPVLSVRAH